jgi:RNA polymerase sigma factor (TIGR02999 family)
VRTKTKTGPAVRDSNRAHAFCSLMRETRGKTAIQKEFFAGNLVQGSDAQCMAEGEEGVSQASQHEVTRLLRAWGAGDESALEQLMPLVYAELHRLAHRYMSIEQPAQTLQTTALVHEVYLRLIDVKQVDWQDRAHFYAICARLMRRILVDFARSRSYQKRGGGITHVQLDDAATVSAVVGSELVAVDNALKRLAALDLRKSQVVELRFFGGLSVEETASALKVSSETVLRDWRLARSWLMRELSPEKPHEA